MLRIQTAVSVLISVMILPLLGYALFFRKIDEEQSQAVSGAYISFGIAALIFGLLAIKLVMSGKIPASKEMRVVAAFFIFSAVMPLLSFFILQTGIGRASLFAMEMAANGLLFFVFYFAIRLNYISVTTVAVCLAILGIYAGYTALTETLAIRCSLRRLEGSAGTNLLGSMTAASGISCLLLATRSATRFLLLRWLFLAAAAVCVFLVILIGSRQALLAFSLAAAILAVVAYGFIRITVIGLVLVFGINVAFATLSDGVDLYHLQQRLSSENITGASQQRLQIYARTFAETDVGAVLFGRPNLYEVWREESAHPHNIFLSSLRHLGIVPTGLLLAGMVMTAVKIRKSAQSQDDSVAIVTAGLYLLLAFLYVMVSGNMTRSFNLPIFWGLALGAADSAKLALDRRLPVSK